MFDSNQDKSDAAARLPGVLALCSKIGVISALLLLQSSIVSAQNCQTERVSVTSTGAELPFPAFDTGAAMSGDARMVIFASRTDGVVPGDANGFIDVFLNDRQTGTIRRISVGLGGAEPDGNSVVSSLSGDGRYALIQSFATNLVPGDTNAQRDLFLVDLQGGATTRVNVDSQGHQSQVSSQLSAALSRNGRRVAFVSRASDLVQGDTNAVSDVFVRDLDAGTTVRVSVSSNGTQANDMSGGDGSTITDAPGLSDDGRFVVFSSRASNLVQGDTNGGADIFVHDMLTGSTERVSVDSSGGELMHTTCADGVISGDGRYVGFVFSIVSPRIPAPLPLGIYLRDRVSGTTNLIALAGVAGDSAISSLDLTPDGQSIVFTTTRATPPGYLQVWARNLQTGTTRLVSADMQGQVPLDGGSQALGISDDGSTALFMSFSSHIVSGDTNGSGDIFVQTCPSDWGVPFCMGTVTSCPCANGGAGIGGCDNSQATGGAKLRASGLASVTDDRLTLIVTDLTASTTSLFFQGDAQVAGGTGAPFGGGLRCVAGNLHRLGARAATDGTCWYGWLGQDVPVSVKGAVPASGATRDYQAWYRDPASMCGATSNLSNGVEVQWMP